MHGFAYEPVFIMNEHGCGCNGITLGQVDCVSFNPVGRRYVRARIRSLESARISPRKYLSFYLFIFFPLNREIRDDEETVAAFESSRCERDPRNFEYAGDLRGHYCADRRAAHNVYFPRGARHKGKCKLTDLKLSSRARWTRRCTFRCTFRRSTRRDFIYSPRHSDAMVIRFK